MISQKPYLGFPQWLFSILTMLISIPTNGLPGCFPRSLVEYGNGFTLLSNIDSYEAVHGQWRLTVNTLQDVQLKPKHQKQLFSVNKTLG